MATPRISIVTSSYNQGRFIERTILSVMAQDYSNWEHIIVDGMSTDETPEILARYTHLKMIREADGGQAEAINKGFRAATGQIFTFLNSDDTLVPGTFKKVADELNPAEGRYIVMGRCRFVDQNDLFCGIEHPSFFINHRHMLAIWKGHGIPQPAVFWDRSVWEACGPMDERDHLVLDYDLFCRFSRQYIFYRVDQVFSNYRLHREAKTASMSDSERLMKSIEVSRRYWGSPLKWQYWWLQFSYWSFILDRKRRAMGWLKRGMEMWRLGFHLRALGCASIGTALAPGAMANLVSPYVGARLLRYSHEFHFRFPWNKTQSSPQSSAWGDFNSQHADGWVGPKYQIKINIDPASTHLLIEGETWQLKTPKPLKLQIFAGGKNLGEYPVQKMGVFSIDVPLGTLYSGPIEVMIQANTWLVPHQLLHNRDYRPLAFRLGKIQWVNKESYLPPYKDGWVAPQGITWLKIQENGLSCVVSGWMGMTPKPCVLKWFLNQMFMTECIIEKEGDFEVTFPLPEVSMGDHSLKWIASSYFVPDPVLDPRELTFMLKQIVVRSEQIRPSS